MKLKRAFTLIELLVVIAIIGILAALLLPALSKAKGRAQGVACLNQGKQMMTAMLLYTADNNDFYPPNPDDGNILPGYNWCGGSAGIGDPQEFNPDVLKDPTRSLLTSYLNGNVAVFKCPADRRMGLYQGTDPAFIGQIVPAARTFSMSQAVGTIDPGYDANEPGCGNHPLRHSKPAGQRPVAEQPVHASPEFTLAHVWQVIRYSRPGTFRALGVVGRGCPGPQ